MIRLRLKEVIEAKSISQSKLSRLADVSLNTIQQMYHDPYHDAKIQTLERLARALGVAVSELYEEVDILQSRGKEHDTITRNRD